jgi:hypothetical protein
MLDAVLGSPALSVFLGMLLTAVGSYIVVVINNKKTLSERVALMQTLAADRATHQADLQAQLTVIRLEGEIAEAKRQESARTEREALRLETAKSQEVLANALRDKGDEDRKAMEEQNRVLAQIALVGDKTHELSNSAKTAMDVIIVGLRTELHMAELAMAALKDSTSMAVQSVKDLAARDVLAERETNARLSEQLKTALERMQPLAPMLAQQLPAPQMPVLVHETPLPGAPEEPHIIQP